MTIEALLLFIPACFALNMAPGPNNLLSVTNGTRYGFLAASVAGIGRLAAFVCMIGVSAAGLATVLQTSLLLFYGIKVVGAAYLFYLAIQLWRAPPTKEDVRSTAVKQNFYSLARQEFLVAAGNPKAILIFTAFLPQFVDISKPAAPQFAVLGLVFLCLEWIAIAAYAYMGSHLKRWFSEPRRQQVFNRSCASLLGAAGVGLLVARRSASGA
jgi:threonine/homoserine/homoserine lactone efflux protein